MRGSKATPFEARLVRTASGCLVFTGALNDDGYGVVWAGKDQDGHQHFTRAHKLAWEREHGPVPVGFVLEHDCHTQDLACEPGPSCPHRACCDTSHLRLVTPIRNTELAVEKRRAREEQHA